MKKLAHTLGIRLTDEDVALADRVASSAPYPVSRTAVLRRAVLLGLAQLAQEANNS